MPIFGQRWNSASAILGGLAWLLLLPVAALVHLPWGAPEAFFWLAPLVIVPLALGLDGKVGPDEKTGRSYSLARNLQPFGAALAVASFWFPVGNKAALLAAGWLVVTALAGFSGLAALWTGGFSSIQESCFNAGLIYLAVGGVWLVLSRLGTSPMGFREPIVLLTAVHFHFSGFAAPFVAGATGKWVARSPHATRKLFGPIGLGVIAAPAIVAAGFVVTRFLNLFGTFLLSASLLGLAILTCGLLTSIRRKSAQALLALSSCSIVAGMTLACTYAGGEFLGRKFISIPKMALFHGLINSLGFALCGILGWTLASTESPRSEDSRIIRGTD